jgi:hypothetical protein
MEQEDDSKSTLYPASMIQQNKTEKTMSNETKTSLPQSKTQAHS